ncbi:diguanylate cyclase [Sulfurimonas sp.]|uniref:diguanylate cyclase n=1 Tax=Sulfurimonas sp. TaxID=2022749 RepID=UPI0025E2BFA3|nr:diguanylate cyclase [Sulfurimonas sp.]MBW6488926.1 diguanylate cyclase [Sulfurimonas sp.]
MENRKKTVLIVDDTKTNIDILLNLLSEKYDIVVALDGESALETVEENSVDLVLLDIMMPNIDGYEVCRRLKSNEKTLDIPVIFLTARDDEDSIEKAYKTGAIDYIRKPFKPIELLARINTQLRAKELIEHLNFISSYDEMTGICNRRKFFEISEKKFAQNRDGMYAVMIDIDNFKNINDNYGHPIGDMVIRLVAKTIASFVPEDAVFGRLGGEEFCIVCNYSSLSCVVENIEKIRESIEKLEIVSDSGESIKFTISEGVAKVSDEIKNLDELLKYADKALYEAKGLGRNRVVFR